MAWNPFRRAAKPVAEDPITAAAVRATSRYDVDRGRKQDRRVSEAWDLYRYVGEIHYVTTQQARLVGRLGWNITLGGNELEEEQATDILTAAFGSASVLRDLSVTAAIHLQVAGGYHLAKVGDRWEVLNNPAEGAVKKKLEQASVVVTVENPDPHEPQARLDSPVLAALDIGRELLLARGQARAAARSRTAQLYTVFYPQEGAPNRTKFEQDLMDVMTAPLADEMSTASVVPNFVAFPGDLIDKIDAKDLVGAVDEKLHERIDRLVHNLAMIMDAPIEVMEGSGDTNHWGAWLVSEDNYLNHVEPLASPIGEGYAQAIEILLGGVAEPDPTGQSGVDVEVTPNPANLLKRRPTIDHALKAAELGIINEVWALEQLGASEEDAGPGLLAMEEAKRQRRAATDGAESTGANAEPLRVVAAAELQPVPTEVVSMVQELSEWVREMKARDIPSMTTAITAAAPEDAPSVDPEELARLDVDLGVQMSDLVSDAADRALERLGAQLRSMAQGGKVELPDVPNQEVAIAYTADIPNQAATVEDTAGRFEAQFDRFVTRAFDRVRAAGVDLGTQVGPDKVDAFAAFRAEVADVVTARRAGKTGESEAWAASLRVNSILGGNGDPERTPTTAASGYPSPIPGIALGSRALSAIAAQYDVVPGRWLWHHAYTGPNPHHKHVALRGREIPAAGFILEDGVNWFPGDHHGCRCVRVPELVRRAA